MAAALAEAPTVRIGDVVGSQAVMVGLVEGALSIIGLKVDQASLVKVMLAVLQLLATALMANIG